MPIEASLQCYKDKCRKNLIKFTIRAFKTLPKIEAPDILDIGCGSGVPTLELVRLCNGNIIGLDIDINQLQKHRQKRQDHLHIKEPFNYADSVKIKEELKFARHVFQRGGFSIIDVSQKPIETSSTSLSFPRPSIYS